MGVRTYVVEVSSEMEKIKVFLEKIHVVNFLSLRDVELSLKPLTVLVGPNASGKSNVLRALTLLKDRMHRGDPPSAKYIQNNIWAGGADRIGFELVVKAGEKSATYQLELEPHDEHRVGLEKLIVDGVEVISIQKGSGQVKDENNENAISFNSTKLALKSAGDYGDKPVTNALTEFIRGWEFYDFKPDAMRLAMSQGHPLVTFLNQVLKTSVETEVLTQLDDDGSLLKYLLSNWHEKDQERFQVVNDSLKTCSKLGLERHTNGEDKLYLYEGYENPVSLEKASDGTLRLLAYHVLLNQPELPSLIAIEEPERNLHPAALNEISRILEQLAEKTQVIITTHSSQLLDTFNADNLADKLGVLLLRNRLGSGTEVVNLAEVQEDRAALSSWIEDFGIGSAIFHSELLQDIVEG